jgi:hypothetical protein
MPSALSAVARQLRWQAVRIEDADLAVDEGLQHLVIAAVDEEALRQAEQQARENSRLMQTVGAGALSLAAMTLNDMIDSTTGELKRPLEPRDMPALMRVGAELVQLSIGAPTHICSAPAAGMEGSSSQSSWQRVAKPV